MYVSMYGLGLYTHVYSLFLVLFLIYFNRLHVVLESDPDFMVIQLISFLTIVFLLGQIFENSRYLFKRKWLKCWVKGPCEYLKGTG